MASTPSPCYHCPLHRPGCHDPKTCKDWKTYQDGQAAKALLKKQVLGPEAIIIEYKKNSRHNKEWRADFVK